MAERETVEELKLAIAMNRSTVAEVRRVTGDLDPRLVEPYLEHERQLLAHLDAVLARAPLLGKPGDADG